MSAIYRKTIKGLAELEDRTHGLTPRMRALLILVDGQRDAKALRTLWSQEVKPALADLQRDGYIEPVGSRRGRPPTAFREPTTVVLPPAPMADVEIDDLPGFTPLPPPPPDAGRLEGAGGDGVDLLLEELTEPPNAAVAAPARAPVEAPPAVVSAAAPAPVATPPATPAPAPVAPAQPAAAEAALPAAWPEPPPATPAAAAPAAPPEAAPPVAAPPVAAPVAAALPVEAPAVAAPAVAPPAVAAPPVAAPAVAAPAVAAPTAPTVAAAVAAPVAPPVAAPVAAPVARRTPAPAPPPPAVPRNPAFEARRRAAVRALNEEVGDDPDPQVHTLAVRMVRAQTPEALRPLLVEGTQLIARLRDRASAEVYAMRFLA